MFSKGLMVVRKLESIDLTDEMMFYDDDQYLGKQSINRSSDCDLERKTTLSKLTESKEIYVKVRM